MAEKPREGVAEAAGAVEARVKLRLDHGGAAGKAAQARAQAGLAGVVEKAHAEMPPEGAPHGRGVQPQRRHPGLGQSRDKP